MWIFLPGLAAGAVAHARAMFVADETTAAAIRRADTRSGELSAAIELRRHAFPGLRTDNENARLCARTIASWQPPRPLPA